MVPPSCSTSQRQDAVAAEQMLRDMLTSPAEAAERHAPVDAPASDTIRRCLCPIQSECAYALHQHTETISIQAFKTTATVCLSAVVP